MKTPDTVTIDMRAAAPRPLWKTFLFFLAPMLLSNILQSLSGTLNNVYVGQMIGVGALAAVSSFFPVMFFFIAFTIGLGAGASVLIGQAWGARDIAKVKAVAGTTLTVGIAFGLVVAVFGGAFTAPMLKALHTPPDILADATSYARIILIAMPGLFVFLLSTAMLRGVSDTVTPLFTLGISTLIGLVLTPALIRGWGGLPMLGVASGAAATVVSFVIATVWLGFQLRRMKSPLAPDRAFARSMRIDFAILKMVTRVGVPTGVQMIVIALAEIALLSLVNSYGSEATAAYGAVNQVVAYVQFPAISIAITASILGATLTPFEDTFAGHPLFGYYDESKEAKRQAVNQWIRTSGAFDGVIDFDAATRDPGNPKHIRADFDSGDHLHPQDVGYEAMAGAVDLELLGVKP